ncbi:MAG: PEGA domain-containing protein [Pontiella sp.]
MNKTILKLFIRGALLLSMTLVFGCSSFLLTSAPQADIYENGEKIGQTPYEFNLMSGNRAFTLKRFGYVEREVRVTSMDPKRLNIPLQWVGSTRIETRPPGATVLRITDKKELGTTPCGLHLKRTERVLITLNGFESVERDLEPNQRYVVELKSKSGFKSAFYKDSMFVSDQGPVAIYDRIAGERIGITPVRLNIEVGRALEYRLDGHKSKFTLISRTAPLRIEIKLEPLTRVLITGPAGTAVYRAGSNEVLGKVPHIVDVDGHAMFKLKKEGYYEQQVSIYPGAPSQMQVELKEIPYKTIITDPPGAEVYRLGGFEKLGVAPFRTVIDGERVFEIKKKGYKSTIIGMGPGSPSQMTIPLSTMPRDDPDAAAIGTLDSHVIESF